MFTLKHLKMLQHVSILFRSSSGSLKLLILKFVEDVKVNVMMPQHNIWGVYVLSVYLHTESTYTHQMLCCGIITLTFTSSTNFKISNFKLPEDDLNKIETFWSIFKSFNVNILD